MATFHWTRGETPLGRDGTRAGACSRTSRAPDAATDGRGNRWVLLAVQSDPRGRVARLFAAPSRRRRFTRQKAQGPLRLEGRVRDALRPPELEGIRRPRRDGGHEQRPHRSPADPLAPQESLPGP